MESAAEPAKSLQREDGHSGADLLRAVEKVESPDAAQRLTRVAADAEIILTLQLEEFDQSTPNWRLFREVLIEYGYSVFLAWARTGQLREMAARHGRGRGVLGLEKVPEGVRFNDDDVHDFVADLILTGIRAFREKTLMDPRKTWRPDGGASIKTFFVGRVLMEFPAEYQRFVRHRRRLVRLDEIDHDRHFHDPETQAIARAEIDTMLKPNTPVRMMFDLQQEGHDLAAIAEIVSVTFDRTFTRGAVASAMSAARAQARDRTRRTA